MGRTARSERRATLLAGHKRMRKLHARLEDRLARAAAGDRELDRLGESIELASLRLQKKMEQRSKHMETLGNILEKMADAQDSMIANLK